MKKIYFDDTFCLTDAVLDGTKTMTRSVIPELLNIEDPDISEWGLTDGGKAMITLYEGGRPTTDIFPMYQPGEVVAVAQNYHDVYEELKRTHGSTSRVTREFFHKYVQGGRVPVSNKMFVKADLMPHQIRITDIKVERLQEISTGDCMKEGLVEGLLTYGYRCPVGMEVYSTPREAFAAIIDKVYGKGTFENNPWVFAYSFELVK